MMVVVIAGFRADFGQSEGDFVNLRVGETPPGILRIYCEGIREDV